MRSLRRTVWTTALMLLLIGCAGISDRQNANTSNPQTSVEEASDADRPLTVPDIIPAVDLARHSVPIEEVYFDTFQPTNRAVPLSKADPTLINRLRDAIPPIHAPKYEAASEATWLNDDDGILGYTLGGQAWAFPIRILNFHEIVNDTFDGEPVLISYCPLCYSGIVYSRRVDEQVLTFGNTSALYESDMVMLDYETGSYWWQVGGSAIVGTLTDAKLEPLPSMTTTWQQWRDLHPDTLVLSRDTGHARDYSRDPFSGIDTVINQGRFVFPVSEASLDARLEPGAKVLVVRLGDEVHAYPLSGAAFASEELLSDAESIDGEDVVIWRDAKSESGAVYRATVDGQQRTFNVVDGVFVDSETDSEWDFAGRAVSGELTGTQLEALPSKTTFWFAAVASEPQIVVRK